MGPSSGVMGRETDIDAPGATGRALLLITASFRCRRQLPLIVGASPDLSARL